MSEWPELGEELARKAADAASVALARFERGAITQREAFLILDGIYSIMEGIAPWEDTDVIYQIRQGLKSQNALISE